jgi:hypothetical protein
MCYQKEYCRVFIRLNIPPVFFNIFSFKNFLSIKQNHISIAYDVLICLLSLFPVSSGTVVASSCGGWAVQPLRV